ncbi:hypothetical protein HY68_15985 [Streptomyces sp. AcH 505]|uniref:hypothetical protein n=1 Tax=Streptomyces sp. AcH 505 TaxID=352211 RepID=UPI000591C7BF|nr:hypothetical protein HY68_15985 [Streptomyces sp. AcH 505]
MRSRLLALRAAGMIAILVAAPAISVTAAQAHDGVSVTVTPSTIAPGGEVQLKVDGCKKNWANVSSDAFVADVDLSGGKNHDRDHESRLPLYGSATIRSSADKGSYEINVNCDGHDHSGVGNVQIVHKSDHHNDHSGDHSYPQPVAPVGAGGGGTATLASGDRSDSRSDAQNSAQASGAGTQHALIGLVLAGVAAVAVAFRSARRERAAGRNTD